MSHFYQLADYSGVDVFENGGRNSLVAPPTMSRNHLKMPWMGDKVMPSIMMHVIVAGGIGLTAVTQESQAADALLEIDVNGTGDILEVRDESGSLKPAAVQSIPTDVDGLRLVSAQSLIFAEVVSKVDGTVMYCCPPGGQWVRCRDQMRYHIGDAGEVTRVEGRVADKWLDLQSEYTDEEQHAHAASEIQSLKNHAVAVFEDKEGNRYGMVISGMIISPDSDSGTELSMWFNPEKF